jgi:DNA polymerase-3 subunit delta
MAGRRGRSAKKGASLAELEAGLAAGRRPPLCVLAGDDEHALGRALALLKGLVDPDLAAFNLQELSDRKVSLEELLDAARTAPMLGGPRVVVLSDLSDLKAPSKGDLESMLGSFVADPPPDAAVVVVARKLDRRLALHKALVAAGTLLDFRRPAEWEMVGWIEDRARERDLHLAADAAEVLSRLVGTDTARAASELDKLALFRQDRAGKVGLEDLDAVVGPGRATGAFELDDALLARDADRAVSVLRRRLLAEGRRREVLPLLLGQASRTLRNLLLGVDTASRGAPGASALIEGFRMSPFVAKKVVGALSRYRGVDLGRALAAAHAADRASKSSSSAAEAALDRVVLRMTGAAGGRTRRRG